MIPAIVQLLFAAAVIARFRHANVTRPHEPPLVPEHVIGVVDSFRLSDPSLADHEKTRPVSSNKFMKTIYEGVAREFVRETER